MSYPMLNLLVLAAVAVFGVVVLAMTEAARRRRLLRAMGLTVLVVFVLTAVFDTIMIAAGIMVYSAAARSGWSVGLAPIEDFAYPLAAAILLPSLWVMLEPRVEAHDS